MNRFFCMFFSLFVLSAHVQAESAYQICENKADGLATSKDVDDALKGMKVKAPGITSDALKIFKNYKAGQGDLHYTYKFWARDIILWLRKNRDLAFNSEAKIMEVFRIMNEKKLISNDAVVLLTSSVWNLMLHREGIPDLDKKLEENHKKGGSFSSKKQVETDI